MVVYGHLPTKNGSQIGHLNQNGEIVVMYPINMVKKRGFHEQTLGYHQELQHFWVT